MRKDDVEAMQPDWAIEELKELLKPALEHAKTHGIVIIFGACQYDHFARRDRTLFIVDPPVMSSIGLSQKLADEIELELEEVEDAVIREMTDESDS